MNSATWHFRTSYEQRLVRLLCWFGYVFLFSSILGIFWMAFGLSKTFNLKEEDLTSFWTCFSLGITIASWQTLRRHRWHLALEKDGIRLGKWMPRWIPYGEIAIVDASQHTVPSHVHCEDENEKTYFNQELFHHSVCRLSILNKKGRKTFIWLNADQAEQALFAIGLSSPNAIGISLEQQYYLPAKLDMTRKQFRRFLAKRNVKNAFVFTLAAIFFLMMGLSKEIWYFYLIAASSASAAVFSFLQVARVLSRGGDKLRSWRDPEELLKPL